MISVDRYFVPNLHTTTTTAPICIFPNHSSRAHLEIRRYFTGRQTWFQLNKQTVVPHDELRRALMISDITGTLPLFLDVYSMLFINLMICENSIDSNKVVSRNSHKLNSSASMRFASAMYVC